MPVQAIELELELYRHIKAPMVLIPKCCNNRVVAKRAGHNVTIFHFVCSQPSPALHSTHTAQQACD